MPMFDFECQACSHGFEAMVTGDDKPTCPECGSQQVDKLISAPRILTTLPSSGSITLNPDQLRRLGRKPDGTKF